MRKNVFPVVLLTVIFSLFAGACSRSAAPPQQQQQKAAHSSETETAAPHKADKTIDHAAHESKPAAPEKPKPRVPAFQTAESAKNLPPTLSPELFQGTVRAAYSVVREIPETIAQLPCYCHCDRSIGHKSLYSCFLDDHGAQCGVCMNEALTAYKLQKEQKLSPAQIREKIIEEYSKSSSRH